MVLDAEVVDQSIPTCTTQAFEVIRVNGFPIQAIVYHTISFIISEEIKRTGITIFCDRISNDARIQDLRAYFSG